MDGEELATPSRSAVPSHVDTVTRKEKRKKTVDQKKEHNYRQRQNIQKRLKTAETAVPALSAGVKVAEEQNTALNAALQERELRIELLAQHLEDKKEECAAAKKAQRERDGDYADPHTSEESPRIMTRRRGRRARRTAPYGPSNGWRRRRSGASGEQQSDDQSSRSQPIAVSRTVQLEDGSSANVSARSWT